MPDDRPRRVMYDVVVLGLGGMGSAALAHLARRGLTALGIEQFGRGHERGSSAGQSRIIRMAYYEDPAYVPLLRRAYELWRELEAATGMALLDLRGLLMAGDCASRLLCGARASARMHDITIEELTAAEMLRRYPTLRVRSGECGIFEPHAGTVIPEAGIEAHLRLAEGAGAHLRFDTRVTGYVTRPDAIAVELAGGSVIDARRLVLCAGPWLGAAARELDLPLTVQRNVQLWFEPSVGAYAADRFPVFLLDREGLPAPLYGFPDSGRGVKAALHGFGRATTADALDRDVHAADIEAVRAALEDWMPGAAGRFAAGKACMYTLTPDEHFLLGVHPRDSRIVIAGGFSGHGYKFCPVVGEVVADLASDGATQYNIRFLAPDRCVCAPVSRPEPQRS